MKSAALIASLALAPATHALVAPAAPTRPSTALAARQPITGGNWKMNPTSLEDARELAKSVAAAAGSSAAEGIVFPPYPFIGPVGEIIKDTKLNLGSQSIFFEDKGAYTGAVSASMVKSLGVKYVLAGHSERRTLFKDNDAAINKKVRCRVSCRVASMASRRVYAPRGRRDGVFARPRRIEPSARPRERSTSLARAVSRHTGPQNHRGRHDPRLVYRRDEGRVRREPVMISASRGAAAPSRHRRDSFPGMMAVGGFIFDSERIRTASSDRDAPRR